jgi:hypothetical protein
MAQPVGLVVEPVVLNRLGVFPESATTVLASQVSDTEACSALVPVTPEALLRLVLDLESAQESSVPRTGVVPSVRPSGQVNPWRLVAWTSLAWLAVLGVTVAGFLSALERQDRKLELLLERTAPAAARPSVPSSMP